MRGGQEGKGKTKFEGEGGINFTGSAMNDKYFSCTEASGCLCVEKVLKL